MADQGQAILCTIHQPSALLFESFDRLLLLERGGETVYFGDIGQDSSLIREYFARYGATCPSNVNPAEYMLEAIGAGITPRVGPRDWKDIWHDSPEYQKVVQEIADITATGLAKPETDQRELSTCMSFGSLCISPKLLTVIPCRCDFLFVPAQNRRCEEQPFAMADARLYLYTILHFRIHFAFRFLVLPPIG